MRRATAGGAIALALLLAACTPAGDDPTSTVTSPESDATTSSTTTEASATPTPTEGASPTTEPPVTLEPMATADGAEIDEAGNVVKDLGEPAEILTPDGEVSATVTVTEIRVLDSCPGEFASAPENGHFVVVSVEASMSESGFAGDDLLLTGPAMWQVVAADGEASGEVDTRAAWGCYETEERLPNAIGPGETASGYLVLDSDVTTGRLVYSLAPGGGWSWPIV